MTKRLFAGTLVLWLTIVSSALHADERGTLIFEDDFNRNESQETKEELSRGWGSNSRKRAAGNKQVDLKDGAMYMFLHKAADHAVSVTHPAEFRDGSVELKFMLEDRTDSLGLNFADLKFKEVHAGHLFVAKISTTDVQLQDFNTGQLAVYLLSWTLPARGSNETATEKCSPRSQGHVVRPNDSPASIQNFQQLLRAGATLEFATVTGSALRQEHQRR